MGGVSYTRPPTTTTTPKHQLDFFFFNWTQKFFSSEFQVVWGSQKSHLNQKCRKFHEMDKSTKKFFHCFLINTTLTINPNTQLHVFVISNQSSSNLYNKAQFHQALKMRGDNLILTTNPNTQLHIFVISYPTFFKPLQ